MYAYQSSQKDQGFFTFYRQQAQFQDQLKVRKKRKKQRNMKMRQSQLNNQHSVQIDSVFRNASLKMSQNFSEGSIEKLKQVQKQSTKIDTNKNNKQFKKKLLQILQKHNYDRSKRHNKNLTKNFREDGQIDLKYHLEALMQEQNGANLDKAKDYNRNNRQENKKEKLQKVAICPNKFQTQLGQIDRTTPSKYFISNKINEMSNINARKLYQSFVWVEEKKPNEKKYSQVIHRQLLPRVPAKSNNSHLNSSTAIKKLQLQNEPTRYRKQQSIGHLVIDRLNRIKSNKNEEKYFMSAKHSNQINRSQQCKNKIYSIFVENKLCKKKEGGATTQKEKRDIQVARKFKFS